MELSRELTLLLGSPVQTHVRAVRWPASRSRLHSSQGGRVAQKGLLGNARFKGKRKRLRRVVWSTKTGVSARAACWRLVLDGEGNFVEQGEGFFAAKRHAFNVAGSRYA